jgi:hypothetical protein
LTAQIKRDSTAAVNTQPASITRDSTPASVNTQPAAAGLEILVDDVSLISPWLLDRQRMAELNGEETAVPMTLRSVSASISRVEPATRTFGVFRPELLLVNNSALPFSINDGDMWAGRGMNIMLAGGFFARYGSIQIVFAPQLISEANKYFQLHIPQIDRPPIPPDRSPWQFQWYANGPYSVDMPTRFGDRKIGRLSPGQSSISVEFRNVQLGFSNENEWWGPGISNALVLSNNAPGFPHYFLRTAQPIRTRFGDFDARWLVGGLTESGFFDTTSTNNLRSITAGALSFRPRKPAGLTLGVTRSVWETATGWGQVPLRWFELFHPIAWPNRVPLGDSLLAPGGRDQIFSLFARWVMPESGFELYGEWGRTEFPPSLRNFLIAPNHTQAYTLGFQWRRPGLRQNDFWRVQAENTSVEQSATFRDRAVGVWYTSRKVIQGYTNRGQPLGASVGPGSSGQNINIDYMRPVWAVGLKAGRMRLNEDVRSIYYSGNAQYWYKPWCSHDIDLYYGARASGQSSFGFAALDMTFGNRIQPWFQTVTGCPRGSFMVDIRNNTVSITIVPFGRR